jgi:outer membrane lipoprotein-sorting protein
MFRKTLAVSSFVVLAVSLLIAADAPRPSASLSAPQIVDKNAAARGGLQAWRAVRALEMSGKMEAGGDRRSTIPVPGAKTDSNMPPSRPAEQVQLPFVMDLQRPRKTRIEIQFNGQTALQVYDGANGWKLRPFLNRHEVEKFTPEELQAASAQSDLDGPLIDFAAKGSKVELEGIDKVEGRDAYNLKVTDKAGRVLHTWVDAKTFLDVKMEGTPRRLDGKYHPVAVYLRDYRSVDGLMMPYLLETEVAGVKETEKIEIEKIVVNPKLDDTRFAKPQ